MHIEEVSVLTGDAQAGCHLRQSRSSVSVDHLQDRAVDGVERSRCHDRKYCERGGAEILAAPRPAPWGFDVARVNGPAGLQLGLFDDPGGTR